MKKIAVLLLGLCTLFGCKKEEETTTDSIDFSVKLVNEFLPEKGINETTRLYFDIETKTPLQYRIETTFPDSKIKLGNKVENTFLSFRNNYNLEEPELILDYTALKAGAHTVRVVFFNYKGQEIVKELVLKFRVYGYELKVRNGKTNPNQGENVDFDLEITPDNPNIPHYIIFKNYGKFKNNEDTSLQKTFIALNGQKITFGKEYKIEDFNKVQVRINSFDRGKQELNYVIKNNTFSREEQIQQKVKENQIFYELLKTEFKKLDNGVYITNVTARITKTPKFSNKLQYRSLISSSREIDGTDEWIDLTMQENGIINFSVKTKRLNKETTYGGKVDIRDEFENSTTCYFLIDYLFDYTPSN
ncbi:MAG: hypothetical protein Q3983_02145 [Capnocytophaga sp.]|nr:hypothetical protein [Capnocytophaga sp.]